MYGEFLSFIEASWLGHAARGSIWLFPLANLAHVLGAAFLVGSIVVFDLLLLRGRYAQAASASSTALAVAATGLTLLALSGPVLFSAEATAIGRNPVFQVKMALVLFGLANIAIYHLRARPHMTGVPSGASLHAVMSATVWIAVVLAGRSIAYW
jgi:hypothetical protein